MADINFITLAIASFLFAISPGPGVVAVLAVSINRGVKSGIAMTAGEVTGDMIYLVLAMVSLASIAQSLSSVLLVIRVLGAIYLCWIGYKTFKSPPLVQGLADVSTRGLIRAFGTGFMISVTNPKVIVFYLSFLPLFIDMTSLDFFTGIQVMIVMYVSVFMGPLVIVILGHHARNFATNDVTGRILNQITGLLLMLVGAALILTIWV